MIFRKKRCDGLEKKQNSAMLQREYCRSLSTTKKDTLIEKISVDRKQTDLFSIRSTWIYFGSILLNLVQSCSILFNFVQCCSILFNVVQHYSILADGQPARLPGRPGRPGQPGLASPDPSCGTPDACTRLFNIVQNT